MVWHIHHKVGQFVYNKVGQFIVITKWDRLYYKVGQLFLLQSGTILLQSGTGITKWDDFITKWDGYYKVGRLLQSGL